jgi:hypothetical protein
MAIRGRVASFALVGWKIGRRPAPAGSIGTVMLTGSSIRHGER